jgi:putative membrane protein
LLPETLVQVLGLLLSLFLGFRYSQAYNRWWEARVLWGGLVNQSRNWRDLLTRVLPSELPLSLRQRLLQQVVLLMWCLNAELRSSKREAVVLAPPAQALALKLGFQHPSVQLLLQQMAKEQFKLHQAAWVDNVESREFGRVQQEITNALGGLERIRHQPLPVSSTFFIRGLTWAYGYLVFLKLDALGPITAALVGWLVFLTFLMAERIGTFLEHPFVDARFALPMDRFCALISLDLLGASDPLAQPSPTKGPWLR